MAASPHVLVVEARFYADIADELMRGATAALEDAGATFDCAAVPGAFEIPAAVAMAIDSGRYEGYVALGCVIRGETSHYDYVCGESARGIAELARVHRAAIGYGILTCDTHEQAWARAAVDGNGRNKGRDSAEACLALIAFGQQLGGGT